MSTARKQSYRCLRCEFVGKGEKSIAMHLFKRHGIGASLGRRMEKGVDYDHIRNGRTKKPKSLTAIAGLVKIHIKGWRCPECGSITQAEGAFIRNMYDKGMTYTLEEECCDCKTKVKVKYEV